MAGRTHASVHICSLDLEEDPVQRDLEECGKLFCMGCIGQHGKCRKLQGHGVNVEVRYSGFFFQ